MNSRLILAAGLMSLISLSARAGDVNIEAAEFSKSGENAWHVSVTLRHGDTGWEHYADAWRVVGADGAEFGRRVLYHPHENEQPFTRSLSGVKIPAGVRTVWVEAHDKRHGWSPKRLEIQLDKSSGPGFRVQ